MKKTDLKTSEIARILGKKGGEKTMEKYPDHMKKISKLGVAKRLQNKNVSKKK